MTDTSSDESMEDWVMYEDRPEWKDIKPIPQNDGPYPVVQIAYSEKYKDVYNYFRGVVAIEEKSERVLSLCKDALLLNPANYTVWQYRRLVLKNLNKDLKEELSYISEVIKDHPKNYQVWHHRRVIVDWLQDGSFELEFTHRILMDDTKNYHAWQHRQWALSTFKLFDAELRYINDLLLYDVRNNSVWNHRYFYFNSLEEGFSPKVVEEEICHVIKKLEQPPINNESAWNYLRGILLHCDAGLTEDKVRKFTSELYGKGCRSIHLLAFLADSAAEMVEKNIDVKENMQNAVKFYTDLATEHDVMRGAYWKYVRDELQTRFPQLCT